MRRKMLTMGRRRYRQTEDGKMRTSRRGVRMILRSKGGQKMNRRGRRMKKKRREGG